MCVCVMICLLIWEHKRKGLFLGEFFFECLYRHTHTYIYIYIHTYIYILKVIFAIEQHFFKIILFF